MAGGVNFCYPSLLVLLALLYEVTSTDPQTDRWKTATLKIDENAQIVSECGDQWANQLVVKALCDEDYSKGFSVDSVCKLADQIKMATQETIVNMVGAVLCCPQCKDNEIIVQSLPFQLKYDDNYKALFNMAANRDELKVKYKRVIGNDNGASSSNQPGQGRIQHRRP